MGEGFISPENACAFRPAIERTLSVTTSPAFGIGSTLPDSPSAIVAASAAVDLDKLSLMVLGSRFRRGLFGCRLRRHFLDVVLLDHFEDARIVAAQRNDFATLPIIHVAGGAVQPPIRRQSLAGQHHEIGR